MLKTSRFVESKQTDRPRLMTVRSKYRITGNFENYNSGQTTEVNSAVPDSAQVNSALLNESNFSRTQVKSRNVNLRTKDEGLTDN